MGWISSRKDKMCLRWNKIRTGRLSDYLIENKWRLIDCCDYIKYNTVTHHIISSYMTHHTTATLPVNWQIDVASIIMMAQTLHVGHIASSKIKIFLWFFGTRNVLQCFFKAFIYYHKISQRRLACSTYHTQTPLKYLIVSLSADIHWEIYILNYWWIPSNGGMSARKKCHE